MEENLMIDVPTGAQIRQSGEEEAEAGEGSDEMAAAILAMVRAETGDSSLYMLPAESFGLDEAELSCDGPSDCSRIYHNFPFSPPSFSTSSRAAESKAKELDGAREKGSESLEEEEEGFYDEEYEECEEEMGSREQTYGSGGEWVLEAILRRRVNRDREGGPWVYQCKWAGYDEPTWETREVMEDAGYIPQLDAFDEERERGSQGLPSATLPPAFVLPSTSSAADAASDTAGYYDKLLSVFGPTPELAAHRLLVSLRGRVYRYAFLRNDTTAKAFYNRWEEVRDTHYPMFVYHGTNPKNYFSIRNKTLLPGGTGGILVRNGTLYGRGVYTSPSIEVPSNYGDCGAIILCIGLVPRRAAEFPNDVKKVATCNLLVFCDHTLVYPVALLQVGRGRGVGAVPLRAPPQHLSLETFEKAARGRLMLGDGIGVGSANGPWRRRGNSGLRDRVPHGQRFSSTEDEAKAKSEVEKFRQGGQGGGIRYRDLRGAPREVKEMARKVLRK